MKPKSDVNLLRSFERFRVKWQRQTHVFCIVLAFALFMLHNLNISVPEPFNLSFIGLLIAYVLLDVAHNTYKDVHIQVCEDQTESDQVISTWLQEHAAKRAIVIDYSSHTIRRPLLLGLLKAQLQVELYLQTLSNVEAMKSERQKRLILDGLEELKTDFKPYLDNGRLHIHFYDVSPTVQVVKIDESLLEIGFFVWEHVFDTAGLDESMRQAINQHEFGLYQGPASEDQIRLWSHTKPRFIVSRNAPEYDILDRFVNKQIKNFEIYNDVSADSNALAEMLRELGARAVPKDTHDNIY